MDREKGGEDRGASRGRRFNAFLLFFFLAFLFVAYTTLPGLPWFTRSKRGRAAVEAGWMDECFFNSSAFEFTRTRLNDKSNQMMNQYHRPLSSKSRFIVINSFTASLYVVCL